MPASELAAVLIKQQHNVTSDSRSYRGMKLPRVMHEYILLWRRPEVITSFLTDLACMAQQQSARLTSTWKALVRTVLVSLGGQASLSQIYEKVAKHAPERLASNPHWQAKVRQTLNQNQSFFAPVERGVWSLAS